MKRNVTVLVLSLAALTLSACGGSIGAPKMPVEEAKALNAMVSGNYQATKGTYENVKTTGGQIGEATDFDVNQLTNIDEFKGALTECFNAPLEAAEAAAGEATEAAENVGEGKDVAASQDLKAGMLDAKYGYEKVKNCPSNSEEKFSAFTAAAGEQPGNFYKAKITQIDMLRKDIGYRLPKSVEELSTMAPDALAKAAEIRASAEAALKATEANPMASAEQKAKAKADYDAVIADLDAVEATAKAIPEDLAAMPAELGKLATEIVNDLQNFGQAGSDS